MTIRAILLTMALAAGAPAIAAPAPATDRAPPPSMGPSLQPGRVPPGYLAGKPPVDVLKVLPPPPAVDSAQGIADRVIYATSAAGIGGPAWQAAVAELNPTSPQYFARLSCAVGARISAETTPVTLAMIARVGVDFTTPMAAAKNFYKRPRPFTTDHGQACDPVTADGVGERLGWSYPSGHSGIGWLWAMLLSEAAPARTDAILAFGQATGDLRVACRVHWLSDVAYGRVLATSVYDRLAAEPEFRADLARATAELAKAPAPECPQ